MPYPSSDDEPQAYDNPYGPYAPGVQIFPREEEAPQRLLTPPQEEPIPPLETPMPLHEARQYLGVMGNAARAWARVDTVLETATIAEGWLEGYAQKRQAYEATLARLADEQAVAEGNAVRYAQEQSRIQEGLEADYNELARLVEELQGQKEHLAADVAQLEETANVKAEYDRAIVSAETRLQALLEGIEQAEADAETRIAMAQERVEQVERRLDQLRAHLAV